MTRFQPLRDRGYSRGLGVLSSEYGGFSSYKSYFFRLITRTGTLPRNTVRWGGEGGYSFDSRNTRFIALKVALSRELISTLWLQDQATSS